MAAASGAVPTSLKLSSYLPFEVLYNFGLARAIRMTPLTHSRGIPTISPVREATKAAIGSSGRLGGTNYPAGERRKDDDRGR